MLFRFRNQVNATGVQASSNEDSATSRPLSYYQVLVSRLAFVLVFEVRHWCVERAGLESSVQVSFNKERNILII